MKSAFAIGELVFQTGRYVFRAQQRKLIAVVPTRTGYRRLARWKLICHLKLSVVGKNVMELHYSLESKHLISNTDALW